MRSLACYLVVLHHCLGYFRQATWEGFYVAHFKAFFPTVTLYLLVSGFVHTQVVERRHLPFWGYFREKFERIMIPYFTVSLVTLVLRLVVERTHAMPLDQVHYTPFVWGSAGLRLLLSGVEGHYYFLELLFVYLLVFPWVVKWLSGKWEALVAFALLVAVDPWLARMYMPFESPYWTPAGVLAAMASGLKFFLFGFLLNRWYEPLQRLGPGLGTLLGGGLFGVYGWLHAVRPQGNEYWVLLLLLAYFLVALTWFNRPMVWVRRVAEVSFGVYLLHQPYFIKFSRLLLGRLAEYPNFQLVATWGLTSVLTTVAVRKLSRHAWAARFLLGQRA